MNKENWIAYTGDLSCVSFVKSYGIKKPITKAIINITSFGWFHLYIDSKKIDTQVFSPGWTDERYRIQYCSFDITKYLTRDAFDLKVDVAPGWGASTTLMRVFRGKEKYTYQPKAINFEIEIEYADYSKETIVSDETMEIYSNEIIEASIYNGEVQNMFSEPKLLGTSTGKKLDVEIIPQEGEDIVYGERIPAKEIFKDSSGNLVIDFGQNFAGIVEVNIDAQDGEILSFTPGEVLDKDGNFYNANYRAAKSFYQFTLSSKKKIYKSEFSFLGGRYLKLIEYPKNVKKECFTAILVHSKLEKTCFYSCDNQKINRLYLNTVYGQLSNYIDVPTDCPQRDERAGWTADAQVFCSTGAIHFNVNKFFRKWLKDLSLGQDEEGAIQAICPCVKNQCNLVSTGWSDAGVIIPYEIYKAYGDQSILIDNLPMIEKWISYCEKFFKKEYIVEFPFYWGDWLALDNSRPNENQGLTRYDLLSTAYYAYDLKILIYIYKELGKDASALERKLEAVKKAYQEEFIRDGHMIGEKAHLFSNIERTCYTQTGIVVSLYFDLVSKENKESLVLDLVNLIHECGDKMTTGFLGTPYILQVLSDNGYKDLAYTLLLQEEYPSWLYSVNKGATTMWEHYDGVKEDESLWPDYMNSYNHYAYGAVFSWIFNYSVGIKPLEPNYKKVSIKPLPNFKLKKTECTYKSSFGNITVKWECIDDKIAHYHVEVPRGIDAEIVLGRHIYKTTDGGIFDEITNY